MPKEKTPQQQLQERVKNDFKFHPATETTGPQHDAVRAALGRVASKLAKSLPPSRETSLALTKLEEAMFWANAAVARNGDAPADVPASTPAPSGPIRSLRSTGDDG